MTKWQQVFLDPVHTIPVCDSAGKNHYVFNCSHDTGRVISRFGVAFTRNRINVGFEFVCFSYLKFKPLLLTIFIACHEDVRSPATQLVVLVLTVMKHLLG